MYFNHEKLMCYSVALGIARWAADLRVPTARRHLKDQLVRAADGVVLSIAEGCGRPHGGAARRNFFDIAMGSAAEVGAIIDLLGADADKKRDALRVVQMAAKLR
ncbi:MAG: four helix bundle protein [Deltaproteobacteria bacterium]|nr:four helix bundle protein [Deltaproteobacteria bacterium]